MRKLWVKAWMTLDGHSCDILSASAMGKEPTPSPPSNYDKTRLSVLVQI
jgi:hypothetical protein